MLELSWQEKLSALNTFASSISEVIPREGELTPEITAILKLMLKNVSEISDDEVKQIHTLYSQIFSDSI